MQLSDWSEGVVAGAKNLLPDPSSLPALRGKFATDFHSARGMREVAVEYTCIPDAQYPWDPLMMKLIWEFAPDAVPLWVRWVFRTPQDEENPHDVVYGRHALGRVVRARTDLFPLKASMPTMPVFGLKFAKPNVLWFIHEGAVDPTKRGMPGNYLPFDWSIVQRAKDSSEGFKMSDKEYREHLHNLWIDKPRTARDKRIADWEQDMAYRDQDFQRYYAKLADHISDVEIAELQRSVGKRKRERKPTVILGS